MQYNKNFFYSVFLSAFALFLYGTRVCSQIKLTGEQWGTYAAGHYIVTNDIIVPEGKTMIVEPSTVLLFNRYCGIVVRGALVCKGRLESGINFNAAAASDDSADVWEESRATRWNGIEVKPRGSVEFENVRILNSVFGMKASKQCKSIIIRDVMFLNNEQDFSMDDSIIYVDNKKPYTYISTVQKQESGTVQPAKPQTITAPKTRGENKAKREEAKTREPWKLPVRICLGSLTVAGGVLGVVCHLKAEDYKKKYPTAGEDAGEIRKKANTLYNLRNVFYAAGAAGAVGFTITFFF